MMASLWRRRILGLLLLVPVFFLAGCAASDTYRGSSYEASYSSEVPSSFYDNDPMLQDWYSAPYWQPNVGP